jgi:hypothetical protein
MEFIASLPPTQSIKIGKEGARVVLDVPESEMSKLMPLILLREMALKVTIVPVEK